MPRVRKVRHPRSHEGHQDRWDEAAAVVVHSPSTQPAEGLQDLVDPLRAAMIRAELHVALKQIPSVRKAWLEFGREINEARVVAAVDQDSWEVRENIARTAMSVSRKWNVRLSTSVRPEGPAEIASDAIALYERE